MVSSQDEIRSRSGIPLRPYYGPHSAGDRDYATILGDPGEYPYTRGIHAGGRTRRSWIQRELSGEGRPSRSNQQFKELIAHGQQGLDIIGDAPTVACMDPDHLYARYAVGTQGVSICRLQDFLDLYEGIPLEEITLSHSLQAPFCIAGLYATARARGVDPRVLRGSVVQSPYYEEDTGYSVQMPFDLRLRLALDSIEFATREMPRFHAFLEDTYFFSESGLTPVEEIALGLVEIRGMIRELLRRGLAIDTFGPRIAILVNCGMDFFEEVAKIRATRRLFARMMREDFGAQDPRSMRVNITAHTSGMSLTAQQPVNNVIRGTVQALALAFAGVQAMEVSAFDEAFRTPSATAHMVGLRTQQIVALEVGAARVGDPLGGSWYVESLTDELEHQVLVIIDQIEAMGPPGSLADGGYFREYFRSRMERYGREIADGTLPKVGLNCFQVPEDEDTLLKEISEEKIEPDFDWIETIRQWRLQRQQRRIDAALSALSAAAEDRSLNVIPKIVEGFDAGATIGEMAGVMRVAYGWPADPLATAASRSSA